MKSGVESFVLGLVLAPTPGVVLPVMSPTLRSGGRPERPSLGSCDESPAPRSALLLEREVVEWVASEGSERVVLFRSGAVEMVLDEESTEVREECWRLCAPSGLTLEMLFVSFADAALELGREERNEVLFWGVELQSPTEGGR